MWDILKAGFTIVMGVVISFGSWPVSTNAGGSGNEFSSDLCPYPSYPNDIQPATGLWVEKDKISGDITLHWIDANAGSVAYDVFYTHNKYAWDFASPNATTTVGASSWTHAGACNDGLNWFYIVRPAGGADNSTMGYKIVVTLPYNDPALKTNIYWVSLPYNTTYYKDIRSVIVDIEGGTTGADRDYITSCMVWNYTNQNRVGMIRGALGWTGGNVALQPGMAICLNRAGCLQTSSYNWVINGTDVTPTTVTMPFNDPALKTNNYWVSMPISGGYATLFSVMIDIEGGLITTDYIFACMTYNYTNQARVGMSFSGFGWAGTNYALKPGMVVLLNRAGCDQTTSYAWSVEVLTPGA